jgi:hypothetical protein
MIVKPAPGRKVRHPLTRQHIPEAGIEVSETDTYWARRIADGDVVEVKAAAAPKFAPVRGKE